MQTARRKTQEKQYPIGLNIGCNIRGPLEKKKKPVGRTGKHEVG